METIAGIEESPVRGHSSPYISITLPMLGLFLYPEDGVKKCLQNVDKYVRRWSRSHLRRNVLHPGIYPLVIDTSKLTSNHIQEVVLLCTTFV
jgi:hypothetical protein